MVTLSVHDNFTSGQIVSQRACSFLCSNQQRVTVLTAPRLRQRSGTPTSVICLTWEACCDRSGGFKVHGPDD